MPIIPSGKEKTQSEIEQKSLDVAIKIIEILDKNPKLKEEMKTSFDELVKGIQSDPEKYEKLLYGIEAAKQEKLDAIQKDFEDGKISKEVAILQSKEVIRHYSRVALTLLKQFITEKNNG